jgi:chromosome partitioning protein
VTKRLLIASPKGGAGKTTAARNIAVAAALDGVVIATADLAPIPFRSIFGKLV